MGTTRSLPFSVLVCVWVPFFKVTDERYHPATKSPALLVDSYQGNLKLTGAVNVEYSILRSTDWLTTI
jgi:hypothetical protein